ncbi:hypothetical protein NE237_013287 [Protea cynaroides]|uniref:Uncharacterized protein n=1 Tax=Protea cynaroides TaxID=273540 RepID=A0A9Q0GZK7_9MAGN|nr:hypothetical protein NE237_013287 [Protea cynaroides]
MCKPRSVTKFFYLNLLDYLKQFKLGPLTSDLKTAEGSPQVSKRKRADLSVGEEGGKGKEKEADPFSLSSGLRRRNQEFKEIAFEGKGKEKEADPFIPDWNLTIEDSIIADGKIAWQLVEGANLPADVHRILEMTEKEFELIFIDGQGHTASFFLWMKHESLKSAHEEATKERSEAVKIYEDQSQQVLSALAEVEG